jgi:hypothetical protein
MTKRKRTNGQVQTMQWQVCTCSFVLFLFVIVLSVLSVLVRLSFVFLSLYCLYLSVCPFFVIVLSVLQHMAPDYPFGIFKWRSVPKYREKTTDLPLVEIVLVLNIAEILLPGS